MQENSVRVIPPQCIVAALEGMRKFSHMASCEAWAGNRQSAGVLLLPTLCVDVQVYYNNVLSLPLIGVLMWFYGELTSLRKEEALQNPMFLVAACASALVILRRPCLEACLILSASCSGNISTLG